MVYLGSKQLSATRSFVQSAAAKLLMRAKSASAIVASSWLIWSNPEPNMGSCRVTHSLQISKMGLLESCLIA
jgi:hypothetical protein